MKSYILQCYLPFNSSGAASNFANRLKMFPVFVCFLATLVFFATANPATTPSGTSPQPVYKPETAASEYIPHVTYPYADSYGQAQPFDVGYGYGGYPTYPTGSPYTTSLIPSAQGAFQLALRLFAKLGSYLATASGLLIVGALFMTIVCSLTPLCTIKFAGFGELDKDVMRAMLTPERAAALVPLVQDAIGKFQHMQRGFQ